MAISLVQSATGTGASSAPSVAFPSPNTAGNFIVVFVGGLNASIFPKDSQGNTYTYVGFNAGANISGAFYYATNIKGGANTVTATLSGSQPRNIEITIAEFSGVQASGPVDQFVIGNTSSANPYSAPLTPTAARELFIAFVLSPVKTGYGPGFSALSTNFGNTVEYAINPALTASPTPAAIGIQFVGGGTALASSDVAGVFQAANWNPVYGNNNSAGVALHDSNGHATSATVTWAADATDVLLSGPSTADQRLMSGYLDNYYFTNTNNVTVSGLPSGYASFDVIVYSDENNGAGSRTGNFQISGAGITTTTISLTDPQGVNFSGSYTQANNGNGNYVKFSISAVGGFKIVPTPTAASDGNERMAIQAIQIICHPPANAVQAPFTSASPISLNFVGGGSNLNPSDIAGVEPCANWNNAQGASSSGAISLIDASGSATGARATWTSNNVWQLPNNTGSPDQVMMGGYLDTTNTSSVTVSITGLSPGVTYDVLVYSDGNNGGNATLANITISGTGITSATKAVSDAANTDFSGIFSQSAESAPGNYVRFTGISATGFSLTATPSNVSGNGYYRAPINGIQIIPRNICVGIQFSGGGVALAPSDVAGVVPAANWNTTTANANSTGQSLVDSDGHVTGATVTWQADGTYPLLGAGASTPNQKLMSAYLDDSSGGNTTVTFSGLPSGFASFDVYIYSDASNTGGSRGAKHEISGNGITTVAAGIQDNAGTDYSGSFTPANGGAGNYVKLTIPAVSGFTITSSPLWTNDGYMRAPVNAVQIVGKPAYATGLIAFKESTAPVNTKRTQSGVANIIAPTPGQSTVNPVQSRTITSDTAPSLAFSANNTAGNLIVVYAGARDATLSIADSQGNTYRLAGNNNLNNVSAGLWYAQNVKGGANTVTVTATPTTGNTASKFELTIAEFSGTAQVNVLDQFANAITTSPNPTSPTVSPRYAGELAIGLANSQEATLPAGGFTSLSEDYGHTAAYRAIPTKTNISAPFSSFSPISVNFVGNGTAMGPTETAGVKPLSNWNNCSGAASSAAQALYDSLGNSSGASITWNAVGTYYLQDGDTPGDYRLMNGYLDTNNTSNVTVNVSGLPANQSFDVIIYSISASAGTEGSFSISGPGITTVTATCNSLTGGSAGQSFTGQYVRSLNSKGNYVRLTVSGSSFTITSTPILADNGTYQRAVIQAIQILPTPGFTMGVNFGNATPMGASEVAGVVSAAKWNNSPGIGEGVTVSGLIDGNGSKTSVTLNYRTYTVYTNSLPDNPGDYRMMRATLDDPDQKSPAIKFSNLPAGFSSFDVYVYLTNAMSSGYRTVKVTLSGPSTPTQSITFGNDSFYGYYRDGSAGGSNFGDYVVFRGVTGTSFTVDAVPVSNTDGNPRAEVAGVQLVGNPAYATAVASFKPFIATTTSSRSQSGKANIRATTKRLQTGKSRLLVKQTKTQTGRATIQPATYKPQPGIARIQRTQTRTLGGLSRIALQHLRTQSAITRVQARINRAESGVANIRATRLRPNPGIARIQATLSRSIGGVARIWVSTAHVPGPGTLVAAEKNSAPTISQYVEGQLPAVIRDNYPQFALFLQKYYEWLERNGTELYTGKITGSSLNTVTLTTDAQTIVPQCIGMNLVVTNGPAKGYSRKISDYDPSTGIVSLDSIWNPDLIPPAKSSIAIRDNFYPSKLARYADIDSTIPPYLQAFHSAFLRKVPGGMLADQRRVLKYIKQFYAARGTADGHRFLFRILFGQEISFYYPTLDLFRPSDARWVTPKIIRVQATTSTDWTSRQITGVISGATAVVESVSQVQLGSNQVTELSVSNISGSFYTDPTTGAPEAVQVSYPFIPPPQSDLGSVTDLLEPGTTIETANLYGVLSALQITAKGDGYAVGDPITVNVSSGSPAKGSVTAVDTSYYSGRVNALATVTASQIALSSNEVATDEFFTGADLTITAGTGSGQRFTITAYDGATKVATLSTTPQPAPDSSSRYMVVLSRGGIQAVQISDVGLGVTSINASVSISSEYGAGAVLTPVVGIVGSLPGYFVSSRAGAVPGQATSPDSFASSNKVLQDSYYWQDFSYEILFSQPTGSYRDAVNSLVHPAGLKLFGSVALTTIPGNRAPLTVQSTVTITNANGDYILPPATATTLGGVIVHKGASIDGLGNLTVTGSTVGLAAAAISGSYADLKNKPAVPTSYTGTAAINFGTVPDFTAVVGSVTITVTGAALGDGVGVNSNPAVPSGVELVGKVTAANTVTVEAWNISGSDVALGSIQVTAEIVR